MAARSREALPEGEEKVAAVRSMFDAIAPRYDLVNRIMTFRMDVGWRRKTVPLARAAATAPRCSTSPAAPATCAASSPSSGAAAHRRRPLVRHAGRRPHRRAARSRATRSACRSPDASVDGVTCGFALRNFESLPPFFAELARVVRPGGRIALLDVAEPPNRLPALRPRHLLRQGRARSSAGCCPTPRPTATSPARSPTCPSPRCSSASWPTPGFVDVERRLLSVGIAQLITATRRHVPPRRERRRRPLVARTRAARRRLDLLAPGRGRRRAARAGRRRAGRPRRGGPDRRRRGGRTGSPRSRSTTRSACPAPGRWPSARCPFHPDPRRRPRGARGRVGRGRRRTRWVTTIGRPTTPTRADRRLAAAPDGRRRHRLRRRHRRPRAHGPGVVVRPRGPRHRGHPRPPAPTGCRRSCWPARCSSDADAPFDRAAVLAPARGRVPRLLPVPRRRVPRRQPRAARAPRRRPGAGPADGRHRAPGRRSRRPTPSWPPRCWRRPPTATSTRSRSTWSTTRCCRGAPTSTTRPSRRSSAVANVQHLATLRGGPAVATGAVGARARAALHPTPAVCGWPRDLAAAWIDEHEGFDRGPLRRHGRLGRRRRQRHVGRQHPLRRGRRRARPASSPATASWPTAIRPPSWPRPRPSSAAMLSALREPDRRLADADQAQDVGGRLDVGG